MTAWIKTTWSALRDSLWFLPSVLTVLAAILAVALMAAEQQGLLWPGEGPGWLYQGNAEAARTVLNTITGSLITVTGVVFSVTIVAVQLASSQYTPRVLRDFSSDRGNQLVLGVFIGTFTYAVLILRSIRSSDGAGDAFVPRFSITVAVALLLVCVAALIYFIHHVSREIHVTALLDRVARETMANVHRLFPEQVGHADEAPPPDPRMPEHDSVPVCATRAGYVHFVDEDALFDLGEKEQLVIGMKPKMGDYVLQGRPLASVWTQRRMTEELEEAIRSAFVLGPERTPEQDVEFGIVQISDIAIRSLSPSLNDPTTAVRCIDRLSEILVEFGTRRPPDARRTRNGTVHFMTNYTTFEDAIKVAYDDIRHFGASIPLIAEQLLYTLAELAAVVPAARRQPILQQARAVLHTARQEISNPRDVEALEQAADHFRETTGHDVGDGAAEGGR